MSFLRYLRRDRFNTIDVATLLAVIIFMQEDGSRAAVYALGASFITNVVAATIIRWTDE